MAQINGDHYCSDLEQTRIISISLAKIAKPGSIFAFEGELGSGKTTFIRNILNFFDIPINQIQSPTFAYVHTYETQHLTPFYHFDLYRLKSEKDFLALGFEEYLFSNGICLIEWSQRINSILPTDKTVKVNIYNLSENERKIKISNA